MVPATVIPEQAPAAAAAGCRIHGRIWLPILATAVLLLSGCGTLSGLVASRVLTTVGAVSLAATGKGLADHALTLLMQQDCSILDGVFREGRDICEPLDSPATEGDFKGLIAQLNGNTEETALADTYRFEQGDDLALQLSNMTGLAAGDAAAGASTRLAPEPEPPLPGKPRTTLFGLGAQAALTLSLSIQD